MARQTRASVPVMDGPMIRSRSMKVMVMKISRALAAPETNSSLPESPGRNRASRIPQSPAVIFRPNSKGKGCAAWGQAPFPEGKNGGCGGQRPASSVPSIPAAGRKSGWLTNKIRGEICVCSAKIKLYLAEMPPGNCNSGGNMLTFLIEQHRTTHG